MDPLNRARHDAPMSSRHKSLEGAFGGLTRYRPPKPDTIVSSCWVRNILALSEGIGAGPQGPAHHLPLSFVAMMSFSYTFLELSLPFLPGSGKVQALRSEYRAWASGTLRSLWPMCGFLSHLLHRSRHAELISNARRCSVQEAFCWRNARGAVKRGKKHQS